MNGKVLNIRESFKGGNRAQWKGHGFGVAKLGSDLICVT